MLKKFLNKLTKRDDGTVALGAIATAGDRFENFHWNQYTMPGVQGFEGVLTTMSTSKVLIVNVDSKCYLFDPTTRTFANTIPDCPIHGFGDVNIMKLVGLPGGNALFFGLQNEYGVYSASSNTWASYTLPLAAGNIVANFNSVDAYSLPTTVVFMTSFTGNGQYMVGIWEYTIATNTFVFYEMTVTGETSMCTSCISPNNESIYIVGEYNFESPTEPIVVGTPPVRKYDIATHTFTTKSTTILGNMGVSACFIAPTKILLAGGTFLTFEPCPTRIYHTDTDTITTPVLPPPSTFQDAGMISFLNAPFLVGARLTSGTGETWDMETDTRRVFGFCDNEWHESTAATAMDRGSLCVLDRNLYAISSQSVSTLNVYTTEPQIREGEPEVVAEPETIDAKVVPEPELMRDVPTEEKPKKIATTRKPAPGRGVTHGTLKMTMSSKRL